MLTLLLITGTVLTSAVFAMPRRRMIKAAAARRR